MYVVVDTSVACSHSSGVEHERVRQSPADTVLPADVTLPPSSAVEGVRQSPADTVLPADVTLPPSSAVEHVRQPPADTILCLAYIAPYMYMYVNFRTNITDIG